MKLNDAARELIGEGADATLVTLKPDGDELVSAHLGEPKKVRHIRRDPRVGVTIVSPGDARKAMRPYLAIDGTAHIEDGGAPELLKTLAQALADPTTFP